MAEPRLDRRRLLAAGAGALGVGFVSSRSRAATDTAPAVRAAHVTDAHVYAERRAPRGVAAMFRHMFADGDAAPELVLNTGDTVMNIDSDEATGADAVAQLDLWRAAVRAGCPVPVRSCLGNHDLWSGFRPTAAAPAAKAGPGLASDSLGVPHPWYSFDHGGWHFTVLSSAWPGYGTLGDEQFAWLARDLAAVPADRPVCVLSHFPILGVTSFVYGDACRDGDRNVVPGSWQHADCWKITELFRRHPNVKLCLSGHMHTRDRCEYRGVWYVCGGAASGAWWDGAEYGFVPCYGLLDLFADGTFDYRFVDYGWPARRWRGETLDG